MLHMKLEIHGCSGFREIVIRMDLTARVDEIVGGKTGGRTDGNPDAYIAHY